MDTFADFAAMERIGWGDADTARAYASGFAAATAQHVPFLISAVHARVGAHVLDLCCGHGIVARGLVEAGAKVTGLDFSPAMLAMARERVPEAELIEGDAADLPFADGTFEAVTIGLGMPHVPDPDAVLREARRVLKPGGRIAFTVWCGPEHSFAWRTVFGAIAEHGDPSVVLPAGPYATALSIEPHARFVLTEAGFADIQVEQIDSSWTVDDPGAPFDLFHDGTVRGAALLRAQPERAKQAIRAAIAETVRRDLGPHGPWRIPIPASMASGTARGAAQ
ncbi:methyltransferase family protein [Palleronia aestuarii]|uniref:Methyltransferase family protein n=1 Tax=Palleronia aestuarii TaxID=568105 RepID=A0A2W7N4V2_9RHOB|nr:methyltransferase domain-containing protein [Palleronia aestuarii]PZX11884.1 methyltransferase family protein [Palleronia aestuarii]